MNVSAAKMIKDVTRKLYRREGWGKKTVTKIKSIKDLTQELCRREGKKRQVNVAQMSEIVKCLSKITAEQPLSVMKVLYQQALKYS